MSVIPEVDHSTGRFCMPQGEISATTNNRGGRNMTHPVTIAGTGLAGVFLRQRLAPQNSHRWDGGTVVELSQLYAMTRR